MKIGCCDLCASATILPYIWPLRSGSQPPYFLIIALTVVEVTRADSILLVCPKNIKFFRSCEYSGVNVHLSYIVFLVYNILAVTQLGSSLSFVEISTQFLVAGDSSVSEVLTVGAIFRVDSSGHLPKQQLSKFQQFRYRSAILPLFSPNGIGANTLYFISSCYVINIPTNLPLLILSQISCFFVGNIIMCPLTKNLLSLLLRG